MRRTLATFQKMRRDGEKIAALTCYDASFAAVLEAAGVDILLVGDSLGMVFQGRETTLAVSLDDMCYHTECTARGAKQAFIVADMPFGSYQEAETQAFNNAARLMAAGAHMVKIEGGEPMRQTIRFLVERGIPVCAHIGLTPQSVHQLGGYRVQGRDAAGAQSLINAATVVADAGAAMIVLEAIPAHVAADITSAINIPTIGIGAGAECSGQVLVLYDVLGLYPGKTPKFARNFLHDAEDIEGAVRAYVDAVKQQRFPAAEHSF